MFQQNSDMFSFEDSCFAVQKSKESCGRIVMWKEFNLINSFTLEASFMCPNRVTREGLPMPQSRRMQTSAARIAERSLHPSERRAGCP